MPLKFKKSALLYSLTVFLALAVLISAKDGNAEDKKYSLKEAITEALQNNHELNGFKHATLAVKQDVSIASSSLLPKIIFEERFMRTNNPTYSFMAKLNQERFEQSDFAVSSLNNPNPVNDFQTSISFEQPVFSPKAYPAIAIAKNESSAKNDEYERKKEETVFNVVKIYLSVHTAREYLKAAESSVEDAKEHLRIAKVRYDAGLGLYSDVLRASTSEAEAEQKFVSAQKALNTAKRALGLILGKDISVDSDDLMPEINVMDINHYTTAALSRKDLQALKLRNESVKKSLTAAQAAYLPYAGIGGSYQYNDHKSPFGSEGKSWQVGAFLRLEIFDGTRRENETAKAKHRIAESEEYLNAAIKGIAYKVYEAHQSVEETRKNAEFAKTALKSAEEGKRLVKTRYENSLSPIVDLLDAQVSLDHARAGAVAKENEFKLSIANLMYESGTILRDLKIEQ
jgi:outer membrane protein TolC